MLATYSAWEGLQEEATPPPTVNTTLHKLAKVSTMLCKVSKHGFCCWGSDGFTEPTTTTTNNVNLGFNLPSQSSWLSESTCGFRPDNRFSIRLLGGDYCTVLNLHLELKYKPPPPRIVTYIGWSSVAYGNRGDGQHLFQKSALDFIFRTIIYLPQTFVAKKVGEKGMSHW
jgi:hypothetical protein